MLVEKVPFVDLEKQNQLVASEINSVLGEVMQRKAFISGQYVKEFEDKFAEFCGARHCIGVGNGTDAIFIALKVLGVGPGDEVIVPANTFIATSEAVSLTGAKVVFVDCDHVTYNLDVRCLHNKITSRTKAIIPVHLYGQPADLAAIRTVVAGTDIKIVQDCAQAHGALRDEQKLIKFGDILCFSFYPGKNLGAYGDAGAVVTNSDEWSEKTRMYANHGRISKYDHEFEGVNSRMDGIQGAVLGVKLRLLSAWNQQRQQAAKSYFEALSDCRAIALPRVDYKAEHVFHLFVIRCQQRDQLRGFLADKGIGTGVHYPIALPNLKAYKYLGHQPQDFPVAGRYQDEILSLPMYPGLEREQINYIASKIGEFYH